MPGYKKADVDESIAGKDEVRSGVPFWTPPAGEGGKWRTSRVRILPPREDHPNNKFYHWVATHGSLPGIDRPVLCLQKMFDEPCPVCLEQTKLRHQGLQDDAASLAPNWRALVNVVALDKEGGVPDGAGVKVWAISRGTLDDLIDAIEGLPRKRKDITDPETGSNVHVRRKGETKKKTRYEISVADESSAFAEEELLEGLHDLTAVYEKIEFVKVAGYLTAGGSKDAFEDDDSVVEGDFRQLPAGTPKDADDDEDDEEEEEKPAPSRATKASDKQREARANLQRRVESARANGRSAAAVADPEEGEDDDEDADDED